MEKDLFIRALSIDWNEVEKDSCLRHIPALLFQWFFPRVCDIVCIALYGLIGRGRGGRK